MVNGGRGRASGDGQLFAPGVVEIGSVRAETDASCADLRSKHENPELIHAESQQADSAFSLPHRKPNSALVEKCLSRRRLVDMVV
jgi:hypothetical protein